MTLYNNQEENPVNRAEWENPDNWRGPKWALTYGSKKDSRWVVPRKAFEGTGWRLNTAHPKAKLVAGLIFLGFLLFLLAGVINLMWMK